MSEDLTIIALDVDGVLNAMRRDASSEHQIVDIGGWVIHWSPAVLARLRAVLALPGVEGAWLTTWLEEPWLLDDLEHALGLNGLVPHRADHPDVRILHGGRVIDERFGADTSFSASSGRWWKLRAAELLVERLKQSRFAWLDDELGQTPGERGENWRLGCTYERFLARPEVMDGLGPADVDRLEAWVMKSMAIREDARTLVGYLGPTLVASLAGLRDVNVVREWAAGEGSVPVLEVGRRIVFAREAWQRVAQAGDDHAARLWFVGGNSLLRGRTPITAIREGALDDVSRAAQAVVGDAFSG